jgi:hypothetical protein
VVRVACLVAALLLIPIQSARACSCALGDPRDSFARADGAFVGTFLESHLAEPPQPGEPHSSAADTIYSFRLDEEYKGELGEPGDIVEVHSAFSGASCGLEVQPGEAYGLFLDMRERDAAWSSSLCSQVSPRTMREAASPLPAPNGEGPIKMIVGGSFGEAQTIGLDSRGRTLAYGFGGTDVSLVDVCPGRERSLEIGQTYPERPHLFVRDLNTFETLREFAMPYGRGSDNPRQDPSALDCRSRNGRRAVVFSTNYNEPEARSLVLEIEGTSATVVHRGTGRSATFASRHLYMQEGSFGRRLVRLSLRTGRTRNVTTLPGKYSSALALSPDEKRLAAIAYPAYDEIESAPTRFYTVDVSGGRITTRTRTLLKGESYGFPAWVSSRRPAVFMGYPGASKVFNLRLGVIARFGRWPAGEPAIVGRRAFGTGWDGGLYKVRLPGGDVTKVRRLPSPVTYALEAVRG